MKQFQCYKCKEYFDEGSEEKAVQELKKNFGKAFEPKDCEAFCDNCYKEFMEYSNMMKENNMDDLETLINYANGTVDFSNIASCSFEFIEELYEQIKQPLQERKEKEIPEASTLLSDEGG